MATRDKAGRPIVVVTGMGIVTSLGTGKDENWTKLTAGESGIRQITRFDTTGLRTTIAGTVDHVYTPGMEPSVLSEAIAWLAGEEAIAESRLGGTSSFPGPLFLAMPPLEIEWSHRLALSEDAPAGQPVDYGTLIQAASGVRVGRHVDPAGRGGDPARRVLGCTGHRCRRIGDAGIAGALLAALGALDLQRHSGRGLSAVLQEPRRIRPGRRRGGAGAGGLRPCSRARRPDRGRHRGMRREVGFVPPHPVEPGREA